MSFLEKALGPSTSAAPADGPKTGMRARRRASPKPEHERQLGPSRRKRPRGDGPGRRTRRGRPRPRRGRWRRARCRGCREPSATRDRWSSRRAPAQARAPARPRRRAGSSSAPSLLSSCRSPRAWLASTPESRFPASRRSRPAAGAPARRPCRPRHRQAAPSRRRHATAAADVGSEVVGLGTAQAVDAEAPERDDHRRERCSRARSARSLRAAGARWRSRGEPRSSSRRRPGGRLGAMGRKQAGPDRRGA